ncbi:hypothetical protein [Novosphingobium humi]|uniref:Uncharacterized protein n=1 Tax=Novosphingobium humi TaxID=2282397 RepID=A0ABY7TWZ8_9SPHN|nr:hypothetical protein [Novosphingobium humi]WCT76344.1 hypothetical protein PQ457_10315 [Novosphingobium humi]
MARESHVTMGNMTGQRHSAIELVTLSYLLSYLPYVILTRYLATNGMDGHGHPLTGLHILPVMLISAAVSTYGFIWISGWGRLMHRVRVGGLSLPGATRATFWSGLCTVFVLTTVPLSYTFRDVSIPFMQLLMRGDILIIAPLVDLLLGRRVHWWSWGALVLVALALFHTLRARGGLALPPLALITLLIYTAGYFGRLWVMTRVAKDDDPIRLRRFFSEEKLVAFPIAILSLAVIAWTDRTPGGAGAQLLWGFTQAWRSEHLPAMILTGLMVCATGVFSGLILLDGRENSFCVPLERSASILAGVGGTVILAQFYGGKWPSGAEFVGAGLLLIAVLLLSVGPRLRH